MGTGTDVGLFGPSSVAWRRHGDPIMWIAGVRALYLQALHPQAMFGVAQNSDYRDDPWGRLMRTSGYVATTIYGTRAEARDAGARVRGIHRRLRATDPATGQTYRVDRPDLLRWVHCAQVDSFAGTGLRVGLLDAAGADRYVAELRRAAALVGLRPGDVPGDMAELDAYLTGVRPSLRATSEARAAARFLLLPVPTQRWLRPLRVGWLPVGALSFLALPGWARALYGVPGPPDALVTPLLRGARYAALAVPPALRTRPEIRAARRRVGRSSPGAGTPDGGAPDSRG
jgi:uncharacterized protein (DUF2236 family)